MKACKFPRASVSNAAKLVPSENRIIPSQLCELKVRNKYVGLTRSEDSWEAFFLTFSLHLKITCKTLVFSDLKLHQWNYCLHCNKAWVPLCLSLVIYIYYLLGLWNSNMTYDNLVWLCLYSIISINNFFPNKSTSRSIRGLGLANVFLDDLDNSLQ